MCGHCGCGEQEHEHEHADGTRHSHSHSHSHTHAPTTLVELQTRVLAKNDAIAGSDRSTRQGARSDPRQEGPRGAWTD